MVDYFDQIMIMFQQQKRLMYGQPLYLGGASGVSGGVDGRSGGFVGQLPQTRIAYDSTEGAVVGSAGSPTLLDNLNHIRYRLGIVESGGVSGQINVANSDIIVASGVTVLDFSSDFSVTESPTGEANVAFAEDKVAIAGDSMTGMLKIDNTGVEHALEVSNYDTAAAFQFTGIYFNQYNNAGTPEKIPYAKIYGATNVVTDGSESGVLIMRVMAYGTEIETLRMANHESVFNEGATNRNFRVEGVNDVNNFIVDADVNRIGVGTATPTARVDVVGRADEIQLRVKANATQTANIFDVRDASNNPLLAVLDDGRIGIGNESVTGSEFVRILGDGYTNLLVLEKTDGASLYVNIDNGTNSWNLGIGTNEDFYIYDVTAVTFPFRIVNGALTDALVVAVSELVINDSGLDYNFRVEGDNDENNFIVDADVDRVGIGIAAPTARFNVVGRADEVQTLIKGYSTQTSNIFEVVKSTDISVLNVTNTEVIINDDKAVSADFVVRGNSDDSLFMADVSNNTLAIGAVDSSSKLSIFSTSDLRTLFVKGFAGQTANIFEIRDSGGALLFEVTPEGRVEILGGYTGYPTILSVTHTQAIAANSETNVGIFTQHNITNAGGYTSATSRGMYVQAGLTGTGGLGTLMGAYLSAAHASSGAVSTIYGSYNFVGLSGGGTASSMYAVGVVASITSGSVTNLRGVNIAALGADSTTAIGLYIGSISGASSANWAIYTTVGGVHFGDATQIYGSQDTQQLIIKGHSTQTSDLVQVVDNSVNVLLSVALDETVINETGLATHDFRVESDSNTHMLFVDADTNQVGIGTSTIYGDTTILGKTFLQENVAGSNSLPLSIANYQAAADFQATRLSFNLLNDGAVGKTYAQFVAYSADVTAGTEDGTFLINTLVGGSSIESFRIDGGNVVINEGSLATVDFRVESDNNTHMLFVDAGNDKVGINTDAPATELHINGALTLTEKSADPSDPAEGDMVLWMSDGTATGDDGDVLIKITAGSVTKTVLLIDFSEV